MRLFLTITLAAMLGIATDRWILSPTVSAERINMPSRDHLLPDSRQDTRTPAFRTRVSQAIDQNNTAAVWTALAAAFGDATPEEVRAALKALLQQPVANEAQPWKDPSRPRAEAMIELLLFWQMPEMVTDLLTEVPDRITRSLLMRAFQAHYQKDPTTASALAEASLGKHFEGFDWMAETVTFAGPITVRWTLPDPLSETDDCLAELDALSPQERFQIIKAMYHSPGGIGNPISNFWTTYPEIAARFVERMPAGSNERGNEILTVAKAWAETDPENAVAWLESLNDLAGTQSAWGGTLQAWAERDPQAAAGWLEGKPFDERTQTAAWAIAEQWADNDPHKALHWASSLSDPELRREALKRSAFQWGRNDPETALALVLHTVDGETQDVMLRAVYQAYGNADLETAWESVDLLDEAQRKTALGALLERAHFSGLEDLSLHVEIATAHAQTHPTTPENQAHVPVLNRLAMTMAQQDATHALTWALSLPEGDPRDASLSGLFQQWSQVDPITATEALATLSPGPDRDTAIDAAFYGLRQRDPERAFHWALAAESPATREKLLNQSVSRWPNDPHMLRQLINEASTLSPELRASLLQQIR